MLAKEMRRFLGLGRKQALIKCSFKRFDERTEDFKRKDAEVVISLMISPDIHQPNLSTELGSRYCERPNHTLRGQFGIVLPSINLQCSPSVEISTTHDLR
jgi:hypothetical protein